MAGASHDADLRTREARRRLPLGHKLHVWTIVPGKHVLGWRRVTADRPGVWILRSYTGDKKNPYRHERLGLADDIAGVEGDHILTFGRAGDLARKRAKLAAREREVGPLTVADVVREYVAARDARDTARQGRPMRSDAGQRLGRYLLGQDRRGRQEAVPPAPLAAVKLVALREADLRAWRTGLPETLKATTVTRLVNDLKAALNAGFHEHRERLDPRTETIIRHGLSRRSGDRSLPAAPADSVARDSQILSDAQIGRLLAAAREVDAEEGWEGDLLRMVLVLAATGARFSQVARMRVGDCQRGMGRLLVPPSRKGRRTEGAEAPIPVPVGQDILDALLPATTGRAAADPLLERWRVHQIPGSVRWERTGRGPWLSSSELTRPWQAIRDRAEMPDVIPYALRHSSIVRAIRRNLPIRLVAASHDTSIGMIEKHYAKWIVSGLEDLLRSAIVPLVPTDLASDVVVPLRGRG
jgi:integrase